MKKSMGLMLSFLILFTSFGAYNVYAYSRTFTFIEDLPFSVTFPTYSGKTKIKYGEFDGMIKGTKTMNSDGTEEQLVLEMPKPGEPLFVLNNFTESISGTTLEWSCDSDNLTEFNFLVASDRIAINNKGENLPNEYTLESTQPKVYEYVFNYDNKEYWLSFLLVPSNMINKYIIESSPDKIINTNIEKNIDNNIRVTLNGEELKFTMPIINNNGRTFYPFRELAEALGASVTWDEKTNTAIALLGSSKVEFPVNSNSYILNGKYKTMEVGVRTFISEGRVYVPIRFCAEALGSIVEWDSQNNKVVIKQQ